MQHLASGATFDVKGNSATASVRGTKFEIYTLADGTMTVKVFVGTVFLHNASGSLQHVGVAASFPLKRRAELVDELKPYRMDDFEGHPWAEWARPDTMTRVAQRLEAAGIDALSFTDHPAPSLRWLEEGGHETFDPFAALSYCAAVTSELHLMTRLVVLPYRNPLLTPNPGEQKYFVILNRVQFAF